jgi:chemotaxis response regulator CheB
MPGARIVTKVYILFNHALFGQGIRSLLRGRHAIQIVGVKRDEAKCLETTESLHPEVVIVEQSNGAIEPSALGTILQRPGVGRVVALNIDHNWATVYERRCLAIINSEDLVTAIQTGRGKQDSTSPVRCGLPKCPRAGVARAKSLPRPRIQRQRAGP